MIVDGKKFEKLTGRRLEKSASDADRLVAAIADLATALSKPVTPPVIEVNLPPATVAVPVVEVTVPPAHVTVQDIQPEPRRPWEFTVNDANGNLKYTIIAKPK